MTPVSIEIGRQMSGMSLRKMARVSLKEGELGVALGNGRPLASIRVQILVKTTVNDKRQKARIPATKLQWLPARHAILTSGSGRTLDGRESLRAGRDAQLLPCRPAVRYPGPNAHTGPDGRTSVNQPSAYLAGVRVPRCAPADWLQVTCSLLGSADGAGWVTEGHSSGAQSGSVSRRGEVRWNNSIGEVALIRAVPNNRIHPF